MVGFCGPRSAPEAAVPTTCVPLLLSFYGPRSVSEQAVPTSRVSLAFPPFLLCPPPICPPFLPFRLFRVLTVSTAPVRFDQQALRLGAASAALLLTALVLPAVGGATVGGDHIVAPVADAHLVKLQRAVLGLAEQRVLLGADAPRLVGTVVVAVGLAPKMPSLISRPATERGFGDGSPTVAWWSR